jgi:predicted nucleic acid-binding protein
VIVFDVPALVGAAIRRDSVPERASRRGIETDRIALSEPVIAELRHVFARSRMAPSPGTVLRQEIEHLVRSSGVGFVPTERVTECRDAKDTIQPELALAAGARLLLASAAGLPALHPWRGIRILTPAEFLPLP